MNNLEKNNLKIGDKVNFVVERSLLTGIITKFYKNEYNHEECSVKTEHKTYPHILLHRVSKVKELNKEEFVSQIRKQVCDEVREKLESSKILFTEEQIEIVKNILKIVEQEKGAER